MGTSEQHSALAARFRVRRGIRGRGEIGQKLEVGERASVVRVKALVRTVLRGSGSSGSGKEEVIGRKSSL